MKLSMKSTTIIIFNLIINPVNCVASVLSTGITWRERPRLRGRRANLLRNFAAFIGDVFVFGFGLSQKFLVGC